MDQKCEFLADFFPVYSIHDTMQSVQDLSDVLFRGEDIALDFQFVSEEDQQIIYALVITILSRLDKLFLAEVVVTILKELLMNANKANAKRIFFAQEGLEITNRSDYQRGIARFQDEIIRKWNEQEENFKASGYKVVLRAKLLNQSLAFIIENNAPLIPQEQERVTKRLESAKKYNDLAEAFMDISDTQESAGLGLVLIQLLLKNAGVGPERFKIESDGKVTRASLVIPDHIVPPEISSKLRERILTEVQGLPPLPHSLTRIIALCNNPDSDLNLIAREIEKNPALATDLIKLSNSAGFVSRNKVSTIIQAVKVVGLKNVRNMLYVSGVRKIIDGRYFKMEEVWKHSNRCSFIARQLASRNGLTKIMDIVAVGALLHDLGKFVLLAVDPSLFKRISAYQKDRDLQNSTVLEEISVGLSHPTLGAMLARKWEFPPDLVNIIEFHHRPFLAQGTDYQDIVNTVYMANMLSDAMDGKTSYYAVDQDIANRYELTDKAKFEEFVDKMDKLYEESDEE